MADGDVATDGRDQQQERHRRTGAAVRQGGQRTAFESLVPVLPRAVFVAELCHCVGQPLVCVGIRGIDLQGGIKVRAGGRELAGIVQHVAQVDAARRVVGMARHSLGKGGTCGCAIARAIE